MCQSDFNSNFFWYAKNESTGSDYIENSKNLYIVGGGLRFHYSIDKLSVLGVFSNNRFYSDSFSDFNDYKGFSWIGKYNDKSFDFDNTEVEVLYNTDSYSLSLGKSSNKIGSGYRSIVLSEKSPSFPNIKFKWRISENIKFLYLHGILKSNIYNEQINESVYGSQEKSEISRSYVIHKVDYRLDWIDFASVSIGLSESVVYGARGIDMNYLFPFNFFWSIQHYLGDIDNLQMHGYLDIDLEQISFFYNILIDEWRAEETFNRSNRNWFGHHAGVSAKGLALNGRAILEFIWNDHRIYRYKFAINDYYSHDYPLGFWAGPHSQELLGIYEVDIDPTTSVKFLYSSSKRGELTSQMIENQYASLESSRFSGIEESKQIASLDIKKKIYSKTVVELGVSYINWTNVGFKPYDNPDYIYNDSELKDIEKISFNTSIFYNF